MKFYDQLHPVYGEDFKQIELNPYLHHPGYYRVFFRIDTEGFDCMNGSFEKTEDREAFYAEAKELLNLYGIEEISGYDPHGPEFLYIHPQNISGELHINRIIALSALMEEGRRKTFKCRCVDLYEMLYNIPDELYNAYLNEKKQDFEFYLLNALKTKRSNLYITNFGIFSGIYKNAEKQFGVKRSAYRRPKCSNTDPLFSRFYSDTVERLIEEGKLTTAETKNGTGVRTTTVRKKKPVKAGAN